MPDPTYRKLSNVLIPYRENLLWLADIYFDEQIRRIIIKSNEPVKWETINTVEKYHQFKSRQAEKTEDEQESEAVEFLLLIPGAIDAHVHFNTPGFEDREDFEHGSLAAAHGGVTTVIDMPCTSLPPVTSLEYLKQKETALAGRSQIDYAFWGGVSGNDFRDGKDVPKQITELANAGVVGFKTYLISGMPGFADLNLNQMLQTARWIKETGLPLAVHAEEKCLVAEREVQFKKAGRTDWHAYCESRDELAESMAVAQMIEIARKTDVRLHFVHLSSRRAVELVRRAKADGLAVSAETCPHYLFFTQAYFEKPEIAAYLKTAPPVKDEASKEALWEGLRDGTISFVTTDHAGCDPEKEKSSSNYWEIYGGIPGVEHRAPFLFSEGFLQGRLTLQQTVELLSGNPAKYFGLYPKKGNLQPGADADFALVNLWKGITVRANEMHSKGQYTPFEGMSCRARVEDTYLRGKLISGRKNKAVVDWEYGQRIRPVKG
jgi:allantoinase